MPVYKAPIDDIRFVLYELLQAEKMTALPTADVGEVLLKASYVEEEADIDAGFAGIFGRITSNYFQKFGDQSDALAHIAAKNHENGAKNPLAHLQKDFGFLVEFITTTPKPK